MVLTIAYSRVSWIIFGNIPFYFANKVSTNISSLSVDPTTNSTKEGHGRSTKTITSDGLRETLPVIAVVNLEEINSNIKNQETVGSEKETHDSARPEGNDEGLSNTSPRFKSGSSIGISGNLHTEKTREDRSDSAEDEGDGAEEGSGESRLACCSLVVSARLALGAETLDRAEEEKDDGGEENHEDANVFVLGEQE